MAKFKAGDVVKSPITGSTYTLKERLPKYDDTRGVAWSTEEWAYGYINEEQVELVEAEKTKGDAEMTKLNGIGVGDKVVLVANSEDVSLEIGKVYEVESVDVDCDEGLPFRLGVWWVSADDVEKPKFVKLLEDDYADGFFEGDVLPLTENGEVFIDNDGDHRSLAKFDFEYVASPNVEQADRLAVIEYLTDLDDTELLNMVEDIRASRKEVR